ncbi:MULTISPECIES: lipopolysaccharide biosynthesis protein [Deefgea]|uniref:Oligosaccharide flippase family protein n=1 Tax=Deefgea chitinilytica TaxID=570276 RepID=A0ABS2CDY4_9NEIS|nr:MULTISPECIES: lipopolysaccharide biosynthesis protein [Deefgea]MBM5572349.1 oligosaccharide flippase family protein [Deefgea chitinilytica]MBM9889585.1 lipopolysaccharide biosynthesis protein [Deefgea sp. CFH1-16]
MIKKLSNGFFIGNTAQAGLQFLMIPLLVSELGAVEYGRWGLLEPIIFIFALIAQFGCNWGMIKLVNQDGVSVNVALRLSFKQVVFPLLFSALAAAIWAWFYFPNTIIFLIFPLVIAVETCLGLGLAAARSSLNSGAYALAILIKFGLLAAFASLNKILVNPWVSTAEQFLSVYLICTGFSAIAAVLSIIYQTRKTNSTSLDGLNISKLADSSRVYGLPLLFSSLLVAVMNNADRFLVSGLLDPKTLGIYVIALKLAGALNFLITPIALWWPTARFQHLKDDDLGQAFFSDMAIKFVAGFSIAGSLLWLLSPFLIPYFAAGIQIDSLVLCFLIMAVVIRAIEPSLNIGLLQEGKTHLLVYVTGFFAIFQVVIGYIFVLQFGVLGAAGSFMVSSLLSVLTLHCWSQKIIRFNFPYVKMLTWIGSVCLATFFVHRFLISIYSS